MMQYKQFTPKASYLCSGGWIRTSDLIQVKDASYPLLYPACSLTNIRLSEQGHGLPASFSVYNYKIVACFVT